ncbi:hypothetical protein FB567DRAFT_625230 [Paraphoma chrysanthemicola]|uniref:BTB domain-containing protein n=1 Tax=Paraphoma chrysanthemicola TaxID=798071 RepID=A0A8K0RDB3_9PLEO|nr:hypothetical protein FB567DRAFT_625230 [Paraphoma chrysanthemicola]
MERYVYREEDEFGTETVTIRVGTGDKAKDFTVYEKFIRASSAFVDNALKGPWLESTSRTISLPEFAPNPFDRYHRWLLTGRLYSKTSLSKTIEDCKEHCHIVEASMQTQHTHRLFHEFYRLSKLAELGHYLLDETFTDTINDAILSCMDEYRKSSTQFPVREASDRYKALPVTSLTRSLISDIAAWTVTGNKLAAYRKTMEESNIKLCPDFSMDVLVAMAQRLTSRPTPKSPFDDWETSCKYHSHGEEKPCYREKLKEINSSQKKRPTPDDSEATSAKRQK